MIWSYPKYQVLRDHQQAFAATSTFTAWQWNLTGTGAPEQIGGELVDGAYLPLLGVSPLLGRSLSLEETRAPSSPRLVVIGHRFWVDRLARDPAALGRSIGLNGVPYTIIGVLPEGFHGLTGQSQVFVPVTTQAASDLEEKWNHSDFVVAAPQARRVGRTGTRRGWTCSAAMVSHEIGEPSGARDRAGVRPPSRSTTSGSIR